MFVAVDVLKGFVVIRSQTKGLALLGVKFFGKGFDVLGDLLLF